MLQATIANSSRILSPEVNANSLHHEEKESVEERPKLMQDLDQQDREKEQSTRICQIDSSEAEQIGHKGLIGTCFETKRAHVGNMFDKALQRKFRTLGGIFRDQTFRQNPATSSSKGPCFKSSKYR